MVMKLVNKIIIMCILLIMFINNEIYAVDYKTMSIDLPSNFTKITDYFYQSSDGSITINIVYTEKSITATESEMYTEDNLKSFISSIKEETVATVKNEVREKVEEVYGKIDDDTFEALYGNIVFDINSSEITNIGKENYKAFKSEVALKTFDTTTYEEMYTIFTEAGYYHLCIATSEKSYFNSNEFLNIINSIEISNPLSKSKATFSTVFDWEEAMDGAIEGFLTALILIPLGYFFNKNDEKNNKDNYEKKNKNNNSKIWKLVGIILLSIISADMILMFLLGDSISGVLAVILLIICTILFYYFYKFLFRKKEKCENVTVEDTTEKTVWIACKVCGKSIPYNENETCEECSQRNLKSAEEKQENSDNNDEKTDFCDEEKIYCIYCNTELGKNDKFCYKCGKEIQKTKEIEKVYCVKCGKEANKSWKFCKYCGEKID